MGFCNHKERFTGPYYLDVDNPLYVYITELHNYLVTVLRIYRATELQIDTVS